MKILIDMNLSPTWVSLFQEQGWSAVHWSDVGDPRASDKSLMIWAQENGYIVFTHDLDFGTLLASTKAQAPSVVQIRTQDVMPHHLGKRLIRVLEEYRLFLENGALLIVDEHKARVRILPFT